LEYIVTFRADINGLRAIAVIAVVIFHFNNEWLSGGFAGVDVFFVISGFLMTGIIFKGLDTESFSVLRFYIARANRIIPALAVLCLVLIIFGWFFLFNSEYQVLGKHVRDSLYFLSNHTYWLESGYFDAGSHEKWLLHTWSLSAEWQFYILYPLILFLLSKFCTIKLLKLLVITSAILGFIFCVFVSLYWPDAAYFLLPTRAWQMLFGGVAFLYPINTFNQSYKIEMLGWLLIFGSYFLISDSDLWPGYLSLLPVFGTFLIIQANNANSKITNNFCFQKIGLWSYSIYLWHWPVVVFIRNFIDDINLLVLLIGILLSVLFGFLSYTLIEKTKYRVVKYSIFIMTITASTFVLQTHGAKLPLRQMSQSPINDFVLNYKNYKNNFPQPVDYASKCAVSKHFKTHKKFGVSDFCLNYQKKGGVFLWGDSHMGALSYGIRAQLPELTTINQVTSSGCPSSLIIKQGNISDLRRACDYANALALSAISKIIPEVVIIANKDNHQAMDWDNTSLKLKEMGVKQVILVGPVPQWYPSLPLVYAKNAYGKDTLASHKIDKNVVETNIKMVVISQSTPDFTYVDVLNNICKKKENVYECKVIHDDVLLAWDYGHLTIEGSKFVASKYVIPAFKLPLR
jgi:peptidoglycan/LPS O-acetylase OafA/YrhL